ncbi:MAG: VTT domain-containing protein [Xanthomonadales bacterium]|nr:VTT domain-containing protein [Xanthomonadales bacterium]
MNVRLLRLLPLLLLGLVAVALVASGNLERLTPTALLDQASSFLGLASSRPLLTAALLALAIALVSTLGLPGAAGLFAAAGFLLGVGPALAAAMVGTVLGTSVLYATLRLALSASRELDPRASRAATQWQDRFRRSPLLFALFLRALPVLPNGIATAVLALLRCPWPVFIAASAIGPLGNAGLLAWLGSQLAFELRSGRPLRAEMLGDPRWWLPLLALSLLVLVPALLRSRRGTIAER